MFRRKWNIYFSIIRIEMTKDTRIFWDGRMEWVGVVRVESKGPKTLPCGMLNSNRTSSDFELEVTTVWKRLVRNDDDNNERAEDVISNQCFKRWSRILWSVVSNAAERLRRRAKEWPEFKETKISFWEQFQKNEICVMLIDIQTYGHWRM